MTRFYTDEEVLGLGAPSAVADEEFLTDEEALRAEPAPPPGPKTIESESIKFFRQPDGRYSSVLTVTFTDDRGAFNIPTVLPDGRVLEPRAALEYWQKNDPSRIERFPSEEKAVSVAKAKHEEHGQVLKRWSIEPTPIKAGKQVKEDFKYATEQGVSLDEAARVREALAVSKMPVTAGEQEKPSATPHIGLLRKSGTQPADEIGFWETLERKEWHEWLPFTRSMASGQHLRGVLEAVQRLRSNDYEAHPEWGRRQWPTQAELEATAGAAAMFTGGSAAAATAPYQTYPSRITPREDLTPDELRSADTALVEEFLQEQDELMRRGHTFGGQVAAGIAELVPYMTEFLMTGGLATAAKEPIKQAGVAFLKRYGTTAAKRFAVKWGTRVAAGAAGAVARTLATGQVGPQAIERQLPRGMALAKDGRLVVGEEGDDPAVAWGRAFGDVFIEMFSEEAGGAIGKALRRVPGAKKVVGRLSKYLGKLPASGVAREMFEKAGYHGFLEEMGEERLGALLRALVDLPPPSEGETPETYLENIGKAIYPGVEPLAVEALVLAVPGAARAGVGAVVGGKPQAPVAPAAVEAPPPPPPSAPRAAPAAPQAPPAAAEGVAAPPKVTQGPPDSNVPSEPNLPDATDPTDPNVPDLLDKWLGEKDVRQKEAAADGARLLGELHNIAPSKAEAKRLNLAMQVYIDLQGQADQIDKWWNDLTPEQQDIVTLSQNLPPDVKAIAKRIIKINEASGLEALEKDIITNVHDNYTARIWAPVAEKARGIVAKFKPRTERARQRTLESVLHGWALGKELQIEGAIDAMVIARQQVSQAIEDRNLLKTARKAKVIGTTQQEGWVKVEHPNFSDWKWVGRAEEAKVYGRDMFVDEDGNLFRRMPFYAEPALGKALNKILGRSKLADIPFFDWLTRWNAKIKHTILMTSLFHHQAYLRSYVLGSKGIRAGKAYREGGQAILNFTPELQDLVRGGLTYGERQEWSEAARQEATIIGEVLDRVPMAKNIKSALHKLSKQQTDFLFNQLGPRLKVYAALLEYRSLLRKNAAALESGEMTRLELAKVAASLANDDFGGLHLARIGYRGKAGEVRPRSPTMQHVFRLLSLAPDWTESNVRSMVQMFQAGQAGKVYRHFWGRVLVKGMGATILFNLLMSAFDDDDFWERYQKAWKVGNLRWLEIDITPIYRALGGSDEKRKYFSLIGHFRDPLKFAWHWGRSIKHKGSVVTRFFDDFRSGTDWADRPFTTFSELIGVDDKGVYQSTVRGKYREGAPKGGKLAGRLVAKRKGTRGGVTPETLPSFLMYEARSAMPIPMQNAISWLTGELDGFDAVSKSVGLMTATAREEEHAPSGKLKRKP